MLRAAGIVWIVLRLPTTVAADNFEFWKEAKRNPKRLKTLIRRLRATLNASTSVT